MCKKVLVGLLLVSLVSFVSLSIFGCGRVNPQSSGTVTLTPLSASINFSGLATTSNADLAKIGVNASAVETVEQKTARISSLIAKGIDEKSIRALDLVSIPSSGTTVKLNRVNADGTYTKLATGAITNGAYSIPYSSTAYNTAEAYVITVEKSDAALGKKLTTEMPVDSTISIYTSSEVGGLNLTPQTSLLLQIIKDKVIAALGTNKLDPDTIAMIKTLVIEKINTLILDEGLDFSTVITSTATENTSLKNAAAKGFADSVIQQAIKAIKFNAAFNQGATDLTAAKKIIKEVFASVMGSASSIPEAIVNSFATSFVSGETRTIAQLVAASNKCVTDVNHKAITNVFTTANVAAKITSYMTATYQASTSTTGPRFSIKVQNAVVQAVFPASVWLNRSIDDNTPLNVAQLILMIEIGNKIAFETNPTYSFNPPQVAQELGLMTGIPDRYIILHNEIRIESFEDWQNFRPDEPTDRPEVSAVLTAMVEVGNLKNPLAESSGITANLVYTMSNGTTSTEAFEKLERGFAAKSVGIQSKSITKKDMGPPPGMVMFQINPWSQSNSRKITDFKRGTTATIKVYNNGTLLESKDISITSADLTNATIQFLTPYNAIFDPTNFNTTIFQVGAKPVLEWTFATGSFSGLTPAYAVEVRKTRAEIGPGGTFYIADFSSPAIYSSWNKQDFLEAAQNQTTSLPIDLSNSTSYPEGVYVVQGAVVGLDSGGWPVISGPWRSTLFKIGTAVSVAAKSASFEGTVTHPTSPQAVKTVTVGLFKMDQNTNFFSGNIEPVGSVITLAPGVTTYCMTISYGTIATKGMGGYDPIAWEDDGDGKINGAAGERPVFPIKHLEYHGGALNVMDQNFTPLGPVSGSRTGFNIDMSQQFWK
ncbi:MAG: hypothetical protein FD145_1139 [Candidatus Saganbacteria bacterium]|uniref:Uncharacterized protein n=1 Tax=Candidatus Saganbacteria bacterium TaxID=2575572 RepID=A0A833NWQ4_UNCSA|nr:MAG: hypothetical protein FD145_1139 [Candidatus Saganbacteria bacterium]